MVWHEEPQDFPLLNRIFILDAGPRKKNQLHGDSLNIRDKFIKNLRAFKNNTIKIEE